MHADCDMAQWHACNVHKPETVRFKLTIEAKSLKEVAFMV